MFNLDQVKVIELVKIDAIERQAWEGWFRSVGKVTTTTTRQIVREGAIPVEEVSTKVEHKAGDSSFLRIGLQCVEQRCKLLGLYAPARVEAANRDLHFDFSGANPEQLHRLEERLAKLDPAGVDGNESSDQYC